VASTYTSNLAVEKPGSGDYSGTWDTPVNADFDVFDRAFGTIQSIDLSGGSLTLSTAQTRSAILMFTGALPSNVTVTVPGLSSAPGTTISGKTYVVENLCTNTSAYTVTIQTTCASTGSRWVVCAPPYDPTQIMIEGTNSSNNGSIRYIGLDRVGTLWDYAGSSVPNWVSGCTIPPYLNCDGTTFSSATYPALATILGSTTLPDTRGRFRATLNQSQSRITSGSSTGGVDGDTNFASGGSQTTTLSSQNVPSVPITDPGHTHETSSGARFLTNASTTGTVVYDGGVNALTGSTITGSRVTGITAGSTSPTNFSNIPPAVIIGLTLIRSA